MEVFKYYKRGKGELDTSNFEEILKQGHITVDKLDSKTFISLLCLNQFYTDYFGKYNPINKIQVTVGGYIDHLRSDKDVFPVLNIYNILDNMDIVSTAVQHTFNSKVRQYQPLTKGKILDYLYWNKKYKPLFIGADNSVKDFFPGVDLQASKVRENGKVTSITLGDFDLNTNDIVIVDDILGGGATIAMLFNLMRDKGYTGNIHLWVEYNEGIHSDTFLDCFDKLYIGKLIGE